MDKSTAVLFDLDGVLADNSPLLHRFIRAAEELGVAPVWNTWYSQLPEHDSRPEYVAMARMAKDAGHLVIVITSRPERLRGSTSEWLKFHLPFGVHKLEMWREDECTFAEGKEYALLNVLEYAEPVLAIDNDQHWCDMFRRYDIPTIHVYEGFTTIQPEVLGLTTNKVR